MYINNSINNSILEVLNFIILRKAMPPDSPIPPPDTVLCVGSAPVVNDHINRWSVPRIAGKDQMQLLAAFTVDSISK